MAENVSYDYLWQIYQKEKQTNQLLMISKSFYEDTLNFIKNIDKLEIKDSSSLKEDSIRLLNELFEKRKQKILIYAAYNKQLPQPISTSELEFYNKVLEMVMSNKIDNIEVPRSSKVILRSLKDIPEILLPSGDKIGPFKRDQTIEVKDLDQDTNFLISNSICERI